jgi:hypothetical protein
MALTAPPRTPRAPLALLLPPACLTLSGRPNKQAAGGSQIAIPPDMDLAVGAGLITTESRCHLLCTSSPARLTAHAVVIAVEASSFQQGTSELLLCLRHDGQGRRPSAGAGLRQ